MNVWPDERARLNLRLIRLALLLLPLGALLGCSTLARRIAPTVSRLALPAAGPTAEQTGPAEKPASISTETGQQTLSLPAGTVATPTPAGFAYSLPSASTVTISTRRETATAAQTYAPPAPPTPAQLAQAAGVRWFYLVALLGIIAAGLLAWAGHMLAALKIAAGAVALPILARFFSSDVAITVSAVLVALGVGLFAAWHILKARGAIRSDET